MMKQTQRYPSAVSIAGSDSGGGAGIQADLKTFSSLGVFGMSVITALTAQNTVGVRSVRTIEPDIVQQQLEAVLDDLAVDAVKTGMLPTPEVVEVVATTIDRYRLSCVIADPVLVSTSGTGLASSDTIHAFREQMFSRLTLITPNLSEAEALSGIPIRTEADKYKAGEKLLKQGCRAVLITGGHLPNDGSSAANTSVDILFTQHENPVSFASEYIATRNLHGTGCTLASAIAAYMALGHTLPEAVALSKQYITAAIAAGRDIVMGTGNGPLNHFFDPKPLKVK